MQWALTLIQAFLKTYMYLMAIGENLKDYGFDVNDEACFKLKRTLSGFVTLHLIVVLIFSFSFPRI